MLAYYARHLDSVEINASFYGTPTAESVASWAAAVGPDFRFAIKAHRRITHNRRMPNLEQAVAAMSEMVAGLGDRLGPVLFQFPAIAPLDEGRIERIAAQAPPHWRLAFQFRHPSWHTSTVAERVERLGAAFVHGDGEAEPGPLSRGSYIYLRLRREAYSHQRLAVWERRIRLYLAEGRDVFVYFKHESVAPALAQRLRERIRTSARQTYSAGL